MGCYMGFHVSLGECIGIRLTLCLASMLNSEQWRTRNGPFNPQGLGSRGLGSRGLGFRVLGFRVRGKP